ncbi:MAG: hypothetical protein ABID04_04080, partial [Patescibacteria group bacterium]
MGLESTAGRSIIAATICQAAQRRMWPSRKKTARVGEFATVALANVDRLGDGLNYSFDRPWKRTLQQTAACYHPDLNCCKPDKEFTSETFEDELGDW